MLTLKSGIAPANSGDNSNPGWPWNNDTSVTKITVDSGVALSTTGGRYLFASMPNVTTIDAGNLDTSQAKDLQCMFWNTPKLTSITGLDQWRTGNVTSLHATFNATGLTTLTGIENWDTSKVVDMSFVFGDSNKLTSLDLSHWSTAAANQMTNLFYNCAALKTIGNPGLDIPSPTTAVQTGMYTGATSLPCGAKTGRHWWGTLHWNEHTDETNNNQCVLTLESGIAPANSGDNSNPGWPWNNDTSVTKITVDSGVALSTTGGRYLFASMPNVTTIDAGNLDTSNATDLWCTFWNTPRLTTITGMDQWNTSNITSLHSTFNATGLTTITGIENWDTKKVSDASFVFRDSTKLTSLDLSHWDTSSVNDLEYIFDNTVALKTIGNPGLDIPSNANPTGMYRGSGLVCHLAGRHHWTYNGNTVD